MNLLGMKMSRLILALLALASLAACEDASGPDGGGPGASAWRQIAGGVGDRQLVAVWGASPDTILAVGSDYALLRANDAGWQVEPLPEDSVILRSIWGASSRELVTAGDNGVAFRFDGTTWTSIAASPRIHFVDLFGLGPNDVFACADNSESGSSVVVRHDGTAWRNVEGDFEVRLRTIWPASVRAAYAAGDNGYIARFDGLQWALLRPAAGSLAWLDAWGTAANNVYFVGEGGRIARFGGTSVVDMTSPTTVNLFAVFGFAANHVFAVGEKGTIIHYDGNAWSPVESGTTSDLHAIWGFADGGAVAVGDFGTVLVYDGNSWRVVFGGRPIRFNDAYGFSADEIFFVGRYGEYDGVIRHLDGREWRFAREEMLSVWGFAPDDVFAAGEFGALYHFDGAAWDKLASRTLEHLSGVHGAKDDERVRVYVVGNQGTLRYTEDPTYAAWGPMVPPVDAIFDMRDVWAAAPDNVYAVGSVGTLLRLTSPTTIRWTTEEIGLSSSGLNAITGRAADDIVAVSVDGRVFHYDGRSWAAAPLTGVGPLLDASLPWWGGAFIVAARPHTFLIAESRAPAVVDAPYLGLFFGGWAGTDAAYACGAQGAILEYRW